MLTIEIVSIAHKNESVRQLQIRRQTLEQSKTFADIKLNTLDSNHPNRSEFLKQQQNAQTEINKIDNCITWIQAL